LKDEGHESLQTGLVASLFSRPPAPSRPVALRARCGGGVRSGRPPCLRYFFPEFLLSSSLGFSPNSDIFRLISSSLLSIR